MMSSLEMALYSKRVNEHIHECILMWSNQRLIIADESSLSSHSTVIWYLIDIRSLAYMCSQIKIDSLEFDMLKYSVLETKIIICNAMKIILRVL